MGFFKKIFVKKKNPHLEHFVLREILEPKVAGLEVGRDRPALVLIALAVGGVQPVLGEFVFLGEDLPRNTLGTHWEHIRNTLGTH